MFYVELCPALVEIVQFMRSYSLGEHEVRRGLEGEGDSQPVCTGGWLGPREGDVRRVGAVLVLGELTKGTETGITAVFVLNPKP